MEQELIQIYSMIRNVYYLILISTIIIVGTTILTAIFINKKY